jgi:hypothetical protein
MDIEGGEAEVLADPEWMSRVESIKVEVHPPATLDSCAEMLGSGGFVVERDRRHTECLAGRRPRG